MMELRVPPHASVTALTYWPRSDAQRCDAYVVTIGTLRVRLSAQQAEQLVLAVVRAGMSLDQLVLVDAAVKARVQDYDDGDGFAMLDDTLLCTRCLVTADEVGAGADSRWRDTHTCEDR